MELLYLTVCVLLSFGKTPSRTEARSIFSPFRNIFDNESHESTPVKVINSFLAPFRGSSEGQDSDYFNNNNRPSSKAWWDNADVTPTIKNIFKVPPTGAPALHKHKPSNGLEPTDILNQMKDEAKHDNGAGVGDKHTPSPPNVIDHTPSSDISGQVKGKEKDEKNDNETKDGKKIMLSITKKHFYFQAVAVRPVDENKRTNETIYYVDN